MQYIIFRCSAHESNRCLLKAEFPLDFKYPWGLLWSGQSSDLFVYFILLNQSALPARIILLGCYYIS
jgi:hypothetical protein